MQTEERLVNYLTKHNIYAMSMGDETMDIVNFKDIGETRI